MTAISLEGRAALVTGSTTGIGRAIAEAFSEAGARVLYHSHEPPPADLPEDRSHLRFDLSEAEAPRALLQEAFRLEPMLDLLVSNAGSFFDVPFLEMTPERWEATMNLNLRAGYFAIQTFAKRLVEERRTGSAVVVASTNAFLAEHDSSAYDASKAGLVGMTRSLALALAEHGVRVNAVAPGLVRTPLTLRWMDRDTAERERYERTIPLGRIGRPEDCAAAAVFLASEAASYITGQVLSIDGGLSIQQIGKREGA